MNIVIIGGGASGVMCALTLKKNNPQIDVTILEQNDRVLKKVLKTGNGRCNILNQNISKSFYDNYTLIERNINEVNIYKVLEDYGLFLKADSEGRVYPYSNSSKNVVNVLLNELEKEKVNIVLNHKVCKIEKKGQKYIVDDIYKADCLVVSSGTNAQEKTNGYDLLKSLGIRIMPLRPGLVPLLTKESTISLKGLRWKVSITLNGEVKTGEILFKDDGLSGIVILDISNKIKDNEKIYIDLMPDFSKQQLNEIVKEKGESYIHNIFPKMLLNEIMKRKKGNIIDTIKSFEYTVVGRKGLSDAQIVLGGVDINEVTDTFESVMHQNLYITGEILDVAGATGGYNLYFAWLSGYVCAKHICISK